jgi:hypothetical protein
MRSVAQGIGRRRHAGKMPLSAVAIALAALAGAAACGSAASSPPSTGRVETVERDTVIGTIRPGAPLRLAPGQSAAVAGTAMTVRFTRVLEDSRCPRGVTCVWAGRARVELAVRSTPNGPDRTMEVEVGSPDKGTVEVGGRKLIAEALEPEPQAKVPTSNDAYRLRLAVAESNGAVRR